MTYLQVDSISKSYKDSHHSKKVLENVSFTVEKEKFVTIFGPNGCGKTTLFNIISGLTESDQNNVLLNGKDTSQSKISFLFQNFADTLLPWQTILENIAFPLELDGLGLSERSQRVISLLEQLEISIPVDQYPYECSGGQKQLATIARALIRNPDLLLMDEPFSALDYDTRLSMENKLLDIWTKTKVTTLFISHDVDEAIYLSDKVIVLSNIPTTVTDQISVDLPRPRNAEMMESQRFYEIRSNVLKSFRRGISK